MHPLEIMIPMHDTISMGYSIQKDSRLRRMTSEHPQTESPNHTQDDRVYFFDTTLRDGEQSPGCTMHHAEKLRMAHQIAALGVDIIEAGFAIASDGDSASIRAIAKEVSGARIASLARCKREDI